LGKNWPIQGLDSEGQAYVYLHAQPSHDHGSILRTLSVEVFDGVSGNTICLPILHDKSNAWSENCLGIGGHPSTVDRVREKLIQQAEWEPCTCTGFFGEGNRLLAELLASLPKLCAHGWRRSEGSTSLWWAGSSNGEDMAYNEQLEETHLQLTKPAF
jgi:hypothetical protein